MPVKLLVCQYGSAGKNSDKLVSSFPRRLGQAMICLLSFQRCFFFCAFPSFSTFHMRGWVQPLKLHDQQQIHSRWYLPKRHANPSDRQPGRFVVMNGLATKETNRTQMSLMNRRNLLRFGTLGALLGPGLWNRSSQLPTVNRKLDANPSTVSCPFTPQATKAAGPDSYVHQTRSQHLEGGQPRHQCPSPGEETRPHLQRLHHRRPAPGATSQPQVGTIKAKTRLGTNCPCWWQQEQLSASSPVHPLEAARVIV